MIVPVRPSSLIRPRPDNTSGLTGAEGNLLEQDGAKAVFRGGVDSNNGDFDVFQHDLIGDGDLIIPLDDVGGASLVNASIVSFGDSRDGDYTDDPAEAPTDAARPFTARVEDLTKDADVEDPDSENILISRVPETIDGVEQGRLSAGIFSDNGRIVIEHDGDDIGENIINGTFNIQSGSTDALQIRGPDGTIQSPDNSEALEALGDTLGDLVDAIADSRTAYEEDTDIDDIPIGDQRELIELDSRGQSTVDLSLDGEDAASYQLQTRPEDGAVWFDWEDYDDTDRIRETITGGSRFWRLVLTTAADEDGATATVALQASG